MKSEHEDIVTKRKRSKETQGSQMLRWKVKFTQLDEREELKDRFHKSKPQCNNKSSLKAELKLVSL